MNELYYGHPIQVRYWDVDLQKYVGGIGYHDIIICGINGEALLIDDILDSAMKMNHIDPDTAIVEMEWLNINQEIIGQ